MKRNISIILVCLALSGCTTIEVFNQESPPEYLTVRVAEFFARGPAQPDPPQKIAPDTLVAVLKRDSGFAQVRLPDGRKGYMISADLKPAPPEAPGVPFDPVIVEAIVEVPLPDFGTAPDEVPSVLLNEQ